MEVEPPVKIFGNSKQMSPRPHIAHCSLGGFLHNVTEFTGQRQLTLTLHQGRFRSKYFAADLGPCKTGYESNFILRFVTVGTVLRNTGVVNYILRIYLDSVLGSILDNGTRDLSANRGNLSFQITNAGFPCVVADDGPDTFVSESQLLRFQPIGLHLLPDQEAARNLDFLVFGVAGQPQHFHAIL